MPQATKIKFNFKSRVIKDEDGKTIGRTKKQPSVEADMPLLAADEIATILSGDNEAVKALVVMGVSRLIIDAAKDQFDEAIEEFGEDDSKTVSASMLDYSKLSLEYIASIPPSTRGGTALTEEDFAAFYADYKQVMVAATGKPAANIENHTKLFAKPQKAKANKEVLALLIDSISIYLVHSQNLDDTGAVAERILNKYTNWLKAPEPKADLNLL